jgi:hypothetical protein
MSFALRFGVGEDPVEEFLVSNPSFVAPKPRCQSLETSLFSRHGFPGAVQRSSASTWATCSRRTGRHGSGCVLVLRSRRVAGQRTCFCRIGWWRSWNGSGAGRRAGVRGSDRTSRCSRISPGDGSRSGGSSSRGRRAGFDRIYGFHALRHTAVTNVYRASRDLFLAQRFARHASPLTTAVYTHPSDEDMATRLRALDC